LTGQTWTYQQVATAGITDIGLVHGRQVALPVHFHDEDQVVFVLAGQRRLIVGRTTLCVRPGQLACIPAHTPHWSLAEASDVLCLNLYLMPGSYQVRQLEHGLVAWWKTPGFALEGLVSVVEAHHAAPVVHPGAGGLRELKLPYAQTVQQAAAAAGLSREGYSRRFKRQYGVPPETHALLLRANAARRVLRQGLPLAQVAAESGFSDQSHLGRVFRRLFGVTPGAYRSG
jgi:AraC-like DNA-binding protein